MVFSFGLTEEKVNSEDWTLVTLCLFSTRNRFLSLTNFSAGVVVDGFPFFSANEKKRAEDTVISNIEYICLSRSKQFSGAHRPCQCMCSFNLPTCSTANILASRLHFEPPDENDHDADCLVSLCRGGLSLNQPQLKPPV